MRTLIFLALTPFVAFGGWLSMKAISNVRLAAASAAWPKAEAVVSRSQTTSSTSRNSKDRTSSTMYSADLEFQYTVGGQQYATSTRHFGQTFGSGDSSEAKLLSLRYAPGTRVEVSYDPSNPATATVEPGLNLELLWLAAAGLAFLAPAVMFAFFGFSEGSPSMFAMGLTLFGAIFAGLGLLGLFFGGRQIQLADQSTKWPSTDGEIVYDHVDSSQSVTKSDDGQVFSRSTSYGAHLVYRYMVSSKTYYGNQRRFGQLAASDDAWAADIAARYPEGKTMRVAFSPNNPELSVVEPGLSSEAYWLPGVALAAFLFGLVVMIFAGRASF